LSRGQDKRGHVKTRPHGPREGKGGNSHGLSHSMGGTHGVTQIEQKSEKSLAKKDCKQGGDNQTVEKVLRKRGEAR